MYVSLKCLSVVMTMALKPDQQHIKDLLTETITLLCCNGLHFKAEFSIDALIGITLDQNEVFLVSIKETFQNDKSGVSKKRFSQPEPNKPCLKSFSGRATPSQSLAIDECLEFKDDLHMGDGEDPEDCAVRDYSQQNYAKVPFCIGSPKQLSNKRKHRTPLKLANNDSDDCFAQEHSLDKPAGFKRRMLDTSTALEHTKGERSSEGVVDCHDNSFAKTDTQYENSSANNPAAFTDQEFVRCESNVNPGTCEKDEVCDDSDNELVFIKQEPVEKTLMPVGKGINSANSRQYANDEFKHKPQHRLNFSSAVNSMQSVFLQLPDPAGCSSWNFPETSNSLQMPFSSRHRWQLAPVEPQLSEKEVNNLPGFLLFYAGLYNQLLCLLWLLHNCLNIYLLISA